jgi:hypothetical protein
MGRVRWGVLSTAAIGRLVIEATRAAVHAEFVAVASRDAAEAVVTPEEAWGIDEALRTVLGLR